MKQLASKLGIAERNITAQPLPSLDAATPASAAVEDDVANGELSDTEALRREHRLAIAAAQSDLFLAETNKDTPQCIILDDEDEVVPLESEFVPVSGPAEAKMLKGTDGRIYVLEVARLTPRDANFVSLTRGGTGRLSEDFLQTPDVADLAPTYVLRKELIQSFAARKSESTKQKLLGEALSRLQKRNSSGEFKRDAMISQSNIDEAKLEINAEKSTTTAEDKTDVAITNESDAKEDKMTFTEGELVSVYHELIQDPANQALLSDAGPELNVNCFLSFSADVDPAKAEADEKYVRELSEYLFDVVLPVIVENVRMGSILPFDGAQLTRLLHSYGINLRYMGQIARLSIAEEQIDMENLIQGSRRVRGMPFYWLEMLETEMIARAFKTILGKYMRISEDVRSCPVKTIVSMLNAILGYEKSDSASSAIKDDRVKSKGKKLKNGDASSVPSETDGVSSRSNFLNELAQVIYTRFHYTITLLHPPATRLLSRPTLLRRICLVNGIQILAKDYTFLDSDGVPTPNPISSADVLSLAPILKGDNPSVAQPVREIRQLIENARILARGNKVEEAFAVAQEASNWCHQTIGIIHRDASICLDLLINMLLKVNDWDAVAALSEKNITLLVQEGGPDNPELVAAHYLLAMAKSQSGDHDAALKHLKCAKYITSLVGGPHHPELVTLSSQIAAVHRAKNDPKSAIGSLIEAQQSLLGGGCCDQSIMSSILHELAEAFVDEGDVKRAIELQTNSYRIAKQILNPDDESCVLKKKALEKYIRMNGESGGTFDPQSKVLKQEEVISAKSEATPANSSEANIHHSVGAEGVIEINNAHHNYDDLKGDGEWKQKKKAHKKGKK